MEPKIYQWPLYAKLSIITTGLISLFFILYVGKGIVVPIVFATIIAILLNPMVEFLIKYKISRLMAIVLTVSVGFIITAILAYFILSQAAMLSESLPQFKEKFSLMLSDCIGWIAEHLNIPKSKIYQWLDTTEMDIINNGSAIIGTSLIAIGGVLVLLLVIPVYVFMVLFYKPLLLEFVFQLFKKEENGILDEVLVETKTLIQSYLIGLLIEAVLVAILNSVGLLFLGIEYAVFIGIVGALLNIIPYIGGIIAVGIPMLMALASQQPLDAIWVLGLYGVVQFIDNNIIVPRIVASKVRVNALVSIIVVLIGGALWDIAGMFLALPVTAIIKVICDRIEPLKPFGFLIGDNKPEMGEIISIE